MARPAQGRGDLLRVQRPHRPPQRQQHRRRGEEPAGDRGHEVSRQGAAGQEHVERGQGDGPEHQPPVGDRQQRPGDQVDRHGDGHVPRAQARGDVGRPRRWRVGRQAGSRRMSDEPVDQGQQDRGDHAGQEQPAEQHPLATPDQPGHQSEAGEDRERPDGAEDDDGQPFRQAADDPDQVGLEAQQGVREDRRQHQADQQQDQPADQPQEVTRAARELVLRVAVGRASRGRPRARPGVWGRRGGHRPVGSRLVGTAGPRPA